MVAASGVAVQETPVTLQTHVRTAAASSIFKIPQGPPSQSNAARALRRRTAIVMRAGPRLIYERWLSFSCRLSSIALALHPAGSVLRPILKGRTAYLTKRKNRSQRSHAASIATKPEGANAQVEADESRTTRSISACAASPLSSFRSECISSQMGIRHVSRASA